MSETDINFFAHYLGIWKSWQGTRTPSILYEAPETPYLQKWMKKISWIIFIYSYFWSRWQMHKQHHHQKFYFSLYYIKQLNSMLPWVCSHIDHRQLQNVVPRKPPFVFTIFWYHPWWSVIILNWCRDPSNLFFKMDQITKYSHLSNTLWYFINQLRDPTSQLWSPFDPPKWS